MTRGSPSWSDTTDHATSSIDSMPRDGRALEELTARLERAAAAVGAEVRSPDYILGRRSGSRREIDVTVRSMVGTSPVLVMLECRDRSGTQDVTWIEQIASKRDDVGASVAVAVAARGGFSEGARKMAAACGIELRVVQEVTADDVASWCALSHLDVVEMQVRNQELNIELPDDLPPILTAGGDEVSDESTISIDEPIFAFRPPPGADPEWFTGEDLIRTTLSIPDMPEFSDWTSVRLIASTLEAPTIAVRTKAGPFAIGHVAVTAEVRHKRSKSPLSRHTVTGASGLPTDIVAAQVHSSDGAKHTVTFHRDRDGVTAGLETSSPVGLDND